jgi:hypothetical protein
VTRSVTRNSVAWSREAAFPIIYRKPNAMAGPMNGGFSGQRPAGLSSGSDHCLDAVIHRGEFEPPHAKYTVGDPLAPILAQGVTVVSRHAHFRFTAATLPISVTKAVVKFEFVTSTLTK